ncbi:MAG: gabT [Anaerolineales bacterium]|nr:gabT [Anaerolineales bacterium]
MSDIMSAEEMVALTKKHSFFSWSAQEAVNPIPMAKAKGVYFWDANGKRYFDLNSQLMCVNIGHGDQRVIDGIKAQAEELVYAGPGMATRVRAEIGRELAEVTPGDLKKFFFTLGGAEVSRRDRRGDHAHGRPPPLGERAWHLRRHSRLRPVQVSQPAIS